MCGYFCIGFVDLIFTNKTLIDFTSLFSPYDFEENDKIILNAFLSNQPRFRRKVQNDNQLLKTLIM